MNESSQSFTEWDVWKKASVEFPKEERFRLTDQLIRSSRSVNSNIAEGHGRFTYKEQLHVCIQARDPLRETYDHLIHAFDCRYIEENQLHYFKMLIDEVGRLLNGYITFLRKNL